MLGSLLPVVTLSDWHMQSSDWQRCCAVCWLHCCCGAVLQLVGHPLGLVAAGDVTGEACDYLLQGLSQAYCYWCLHLQNRVSKLLNKQCICT